MTMGEGVPSDKDPVALANSNFWRYVLGFPIVLLVVSILGIAFYVKYEPPKYLLFNGRREEALLMLA